MHERVFTVKLIIYSHCRENLLVKVNCHHSKQFKKETDELAYVDGDVDVLDVDSFPIFHDVILTMLKKKLKLEKCGTYE